MADLVSLFEQRRIGPEALDLIELDLYGWPTRDDFKISPDETDLRMD